MLTKIDTQLQEYDSRVGSSLQMISADAQGRISVQDLEKALAVIKHKPDDEVGQAVIQKLDVDKDGYVEIEHVLGLVREEGLGGCSLFDSAERGCVHVWLFRHRGGRRSKDIDWSRERDEGFETTQRGYCAGVINGVLSDTCLFIRLDIIY